MGTIPENPIYRDEVYQLETTDPNLAGPVVYAPDGFTPTEGHLNAPLKQLADRTGYLKDVLDSLGAAAFVSLVGTVSQSGGVSTGDAMQTIVGTDGIAFRFANGMQICLHEITLEFVAQAESIMGTWLFPAPFSSHPIPIGMPDLQSILDNCTPGIAQVGGAFADERTTTSARFTITRQQGQTDFVSEDFARCFVFAVGRWYE